jgi:orotate phosphoribosyltransferase-like protein
MNQNQQVDKILELRNEGFGYKRIANELKISIGMVRYTIAKIAELKLYQ